MNKYQVLIRLIESVEKVLLEEKEEGFEVKEDERLETIPLEKRDYLSDKEERNLFSSYIRELEEVKDDE